MQMTNNTSSLLAHETISDVATCRRQGVKWSPFTHTNFRIGIVVGRNDGPGDHVLALSNPASSCCAVALTFLHPENVNVEEWCIKHRVDAVPRVVDLDMLLNNPMVDGVYISGAADNHADVIERALLADKHVLVDDPITTSVDEYCRLVNLAHSRKRHLQNTTMFVYHYAVREFLAYVLHEQRFGEIRNVDTCFDINSKVTRFYGFESDESSGCINDLCRYCAIMGLLVFQRSKRNALTAQVTNVELDANGNPLHCICQVKFEGDALLTMDCSYVTYSGTRQSVDVHSDSHAASMGDFAFASNSLACFRLYEKPSSDKSQQQQQHEEIAKRGESIDVDGGPLQEVSGWRKFAELSTNAYLEDEMDNKPLLGRYEFTYAAVQSQNIVAALTQSLKDGCTEVKLADLNLEIP
ncbi:oxidoreductase [Fragilaria crotonensis]|nr:oxidoreductase [Fragilaria crotonensis]